MKCPFCSHNDTKVVDKRETNNEDVTRRRRECLKCGKRFTTYERVDEINIIIVKKDGNRQQFDRQKIERGILKACEKRAIPVEVIRKAVDEIEAEIRSQDTREIPSKLIGNLVIKKLKKIDKVAYIRFASVYREFADLDSFEKELHVLLKK